MAALAAPIGIVASLAGAGLQAAGTISGAAAGQKAAYNQMWTGINAAIMEGKVLQNRANEERAAASQQAAQTSLFTKNMQSKLRANAAASGGDTTDATVGMLGGQIQQQGDYEKLMHLYTGDSRARGYEDAARAGLFKAVNQGAADLYSANMAKHNAYGQAAGSVLGSISSLASSFGNMNRYGFNVG